MSAGSLHLEQGEFPFKQHASLVSSSQTQRPSPCTAVSLTPAGRPAPSHAARTALQWNFFSWDLMLVETAGAVEAAGAGAGGRLLLSPGTERPNPCSPPSPQSKLRRISVSLHPPPSCREHRSLRQRLRQDRLGLHKSPWRAERGHQQVLPRAPSADTGPAPARCRSHACPRDTRCADADLPPSELPPQPLRAEPPVRAAEGTRTLCGRATENTGSGTGSGRGKGRQGTWAGGPARGGPGLEPLREEGREVAAAWRRASPV